MTEEIATKNFSIADAAKGTAYAKDVFTYYSDYEAIFEAMKLENEINTATHFDAEKVPGLEEKQRELIERVRASQVNVHLTGIPRKVRRQAFIASQNMAKTDAERIDVYNRMLITSSITKVTDGEGNIDDTEWTPDNVEWLDLLSEQDMLTLTEKIDALAVSSARFDREVNLDFLSKS